LRIHFVKFEFFELFNFIGGKAIMKKTKTVLATLSVATALTTFAPLATPVLADGTPAVQQTQTTQLKDGVQEVGITYSKTGTQDPSETGRFLGNKIYVTVENHKVTKVTLNVPKGAAQFINGITLNNQVGQLTKNSDGSEVVDFSAAAYSGDKGVISFDLTTPMGSMHKSADAYMATLPTETVTTPAQPATAPDPQPASTPVSQPAKADNNSGATQSNKDNGSGATTTNNDGKADSSDSGQQTDPQAQTATIDFYKTGTNEKSMAANFFSPQVNATVKDGKVVKLTLGISQDASMVKSVSLNGVTGQVTVNPDGSGLITFDGSAYKEGRGVIKFTIDFGQGPYSPSADVVLGALKDGSYDNSKAPKGAVVVPKEDDGAKETPQPIKTTNNTNGASSTNQAVLPQTGDNTKSTTLSLAGLVSVMAAAVAFVLGKKRQTNK